VEHDAAPLASPALLNGVLLQARRSWIAVQIRFIALVKPPFKCSDDYPLVGWEQGAGEAATADRPRGEKTGDCTMARFEMLDSNAAALGNGLATGDMLFELGMMYSVGRDAAVDLVAAHKWFNLAAVKGNIDAIRLRREVASQMSDAEIAAAQRAARDWLRGNHETTVRAIAA